MDCLDCHNRPSHTYEMPEAAVDRAMAVGAIGLFVGLTVLYQLYFASMTGQTFGMRLCGIRLISSRGPAPGPVRGLIRVASLAISVQTAEFHVKNILAKLGVNDRTKAVTLAVRRGIIDIGNS